MTATIIEHTRQYIGGAWVNSTGEGVIEVRNPATEQVIAVVAKGTEDDADAAVAAAKAAQPAWARLSTSERATWLRRLQAAAAADRENLVRIIQDDVGCPTPLADHVQVGVPLANLGAFADLAETYPFDEQDTEGRWVRREPVGVVACITPWNFPLHQLVLKMAPALAAGCTVVLKPTEVTPLSALRLVELVDGIGLPPGVVNLVNGFGPVVGARLAGHPDTDMVSFTGSTAAGKRVAALAAGNVTRVALELGGKSPNIILDDADLEVAVRDGLAWCFVNSGQTCSALTRMIVPRDRLAEIEEIAARELREYRIGDPRKPGVNLGPLISDVQRERVRSYVDVAAAEGARLVACGTPADEQTGYFVPPAIFSDVTTDMRIAQEEIFGPVLAILPYDDEEQAVTIANDTVYGLAACVWSSDPDRAARVATRIRAGQVRINDGDRWPGAPFGGMKQSGLGREDGSHGLEEFLEIKAILLPKPTA
ncbi:aldehyde dehydrogenase family protein [Nocardia sp. CA-120079]|uniref:aldehyde dehydrogenase family protein n=1 Tax=Nocardia sp. CA-120079 TaxID=3239974 RepID=UPI003D982C2E